MRPPRPVMAPALLAALAVAADLRCDRVNVVVQDGRVTRVLKVG